MSITGAIIYAMPSPPAKGRSGGSRGGGFRVQSPSYKFERYNSDLEVTILDRSIERDASGKRLTRAGTFPPDIIPARPLT